MLKRIFLLCSTFLIAWVSYIFYLIISLCVAFISITSGQAYGKFDYHAQNLESKTRQILSQLDHFGFVNGYNENVRLVFANQRSITNLLSVTPYLLGYKEDFKILFCTDHVFESSKKSVALASIVFRNAIPKGMVDRDLIQKNTTDCNSVLLEMYARNGGDDSKNYDAFIWISSNFLKDITEVLMRNNLDNGSSLPMSFEFFILKYWKVEFFNSSLIHSSMLAISNGDFKIKFFDQGLDSQFDSSNLKLAFLLTEFL